MTRTTPNWLTTPPAIDILRMESTRAAYFALPATVRTLIEAYADRDWSDGNRVVIDLPRSRYAEIGAAYKRAQEG